MEIASSAYEVSVSIPFPTKLHAKIAYDVLRVDAEPHRSFVSKTLSLDEHILKVIFTGSLAKHVRVALTSFYESIILCSETMDQFGPAQSDEYQFY